MVNKMKNLEEEFLQKNHYTTLYDLGLPPKSSKKPSSAKRFKREGVARFDNPNSFCITVEISLFLKGVPSE